MWDGEPSEIDEPTGGRKREKLRIIELKEVNKIDQGILGDKKLSGDESSDNTAVQGGLRKVSPPRMDSNGTKPQKRSHPMFGATPRQMITEDEEDEEIVVGSYGREITRGRDVVYGEAIEMSGLGDLNEVGEIRNTEEEMDVIQIDSGESLSRGGQFEVKNGAWEGGALNKMKALAAQDRLMKMKKDRNIHEDELRPTHDGVQVLMLYEIDPDPHSDSKPTLSGPGEWLPWYDFR